MDLLHRAGEPLPRTGLLALERDGLLDRLTETVWVPAGTVPDPVLRASALDPPPRPVFAHSHRSAAWIWWGSRTGRAPEPGEYTTTVRRRVRGGRSAHIVYERDVPPSERMRLAGRWVTSPERTLFDLLRLCHDADAPLRTAAERLERVPAGDRHTFVRWLDGARRRPYAALVRELALTVFAQGPAAGGAQPLTR
ncbi:hypothetical protein [Brevibacterium album]|uniref:hypothetical protein n=1 Tax=Brevibacterium album TaxID=417948 RepID=UPI0003F5778C|nr:hypothetical protein [Brevibacterium album]